MDMEQWIASKFGKEYIKAVYCHPAYLTYMQSTSWETLGWRKHSWNQDCQEEYQQPQICRWCYLYGRKWRTKEPLDESERQSEKVGLKLNIQKTKIMASGPISSVQFSSVTQSCPTLQPHWTTAHQVSLSITNSQSLLKFMSIESVMPPNHLILCHPLPLLPSIFPSIRVFSDKSALCIRWPECWSFCFNISSSNEYSGLISFRMDWLDLLAV